MKNAFSSAIANYRRYRIARNHSKLYRTGRYVFLPVAAAYLLLLSFPQVLFAHEVTYKNFTVYSREPVEAQVLSSL